MVQMQLSENKQWVVDVPRYVIGAAMVLWGLTSGNEFLGLGLGVLIEAAYFVTVRWNFTYKHYVRAWHMSVLFMFLAAFMYFLDGKSIHQMRGIFAWLPVIFFPIVFVQRFGVAESMPLNTFSYFARRRMEQDIKEKRTISPIMVNAALPYLGTCILSAAVGQNSRIGNTYLIGLTLILAYTLFSIGAKYGRRWVSFVIAFAVTLGIAYSYELGMKKIEERLIKGRTTSDDDDPRYDQAVTRIGQLEKLKLSPKVRWRLWVPDGGVVPKLVTMARYNEFRISRWLSADAARLELQDQFIDGIALGAREDADIIIFDENDRDLGMSVDPKSGYRFRGSVNSRRPTIGAPVVDGFYAVGNILGAETSLEVSTLGNLRVNNREATIDYLLFTHKDKLGAQPAPVRGQDFEVAITSGAPFAEYDRYVFSQIAAELKLSKDRPKESVERLHRWFVDNFKYSTHLTSAVRPGSRRSALTVFLEQTRSGHCEYFATATALILRHVGIPTRYCTGYAVREMHEDHFVLRGTHAHAWCSAWIDGKWVDVDTTPPGWIDEDSKIKMGMLGRFSEWWKHWREDFQVWKAEGENSQMVNNVIVAIISLMVVWVFYRLWTGGNRKRGNKGEFAGSDDLPAWKFIRKLDRWAQKYLGPRPVGVPYGLWLEGMTEVIPEHESQLNEFIKEYQWVRFSGKAPEESSDQIKALARQLVKLKPSKDK